MDIDLVIENDAPTTVAPTLASKRINNNSCSLDGSLRGQSKRILGTETTIHDSFKRRILWAQRGIYFFKVLGLFSYILAQIVDGSDVRAILLTSSLTFGGMALLCFGCLYYKNISFVMMNIFLLRGAALQGPSACLPSCAHTTPDKTQTT